MKSERRHELQENELATYLGKINRSIEPYSKLIAIAVGVVAIGSIAFALYQNKASGDRSDATLALIRATASQDPSELAEISAIYPETAAGAWARLYEGNSLLVEGIQALYTDRADAEDMIRKSRSSFNEALSKSDDVLIRSRAHFGLARAAESLGEIDLAIDQYKECIAANESKSMVELANKRIDSLSRPATQDFLAWFGEQDFSTADPSLPPSLPSGMSLPDVPDIKLPELGADDESSSDTDSQDKTDTGDDETPSDLPGGGIEMPADKPASTDEASATSTSPDTDEPTTAAKPDEDSAGDPSDTPAKSKPADSAE